MAERVPAKGTWHTCSFSSVGSNSFALETEPTTQMLWSLCRKDPENHTHQMSGETEAPKSY